MEQNAEKFTLPSDPTGKAQTLRAALAESVAKYGDSIALTYHREDQWVSRTWKEFESGIAEISEVLGGLGMKPQSDPLLMLFENSPEWMETYLAAAGVGIKVVPVDAKLRASELLYIAKSSGASVIVTDRAHVAVLEEVLHEADCVKSVILIGASDENVEIAGRKCLSYEKLRKSVAGRRSFFESHLPSNDDIASIIYTSGTTGRPKGAMLTHGNFRNDGVLALMGFENALFHSDHFLIVLPLFHTFAFTSSIVVPLILGARMSFVESLRTVTDDLRTLQPTIMMAVPLLAEKIYERLNAKLKKSAVARTMMNVGLGRVIGKQVLKPLGGKLRFLVVGGAPCPVPVLKAFTKLGIPIIEGYGLTECSPIVCLTGRKNRRIGSIGRAIPGIELRLADKDETGVGEIQVRGPIVTKGYFNDPAGTEAAFDGDWFCTGDLASMDDEGYLTIRGRKKALIVNREGKNIYPEEVENEISPDPLVGDVVVVGYRVGKDPGEHVGCIITPNMDAVIAANDDQEPSWEEIVSKMRGIVAERCAALAAYKVPRKIVVRREPLERTSVQKVRRVSYQDTLDE